MLENDSFMPNRKLERVPDCSQKIQKWFYEVHFHESLAHFIKAD
jgi:hypothetical protein